MSNPNRSKVLVGFGVVAIAVIAAVSYWPPSVRTDEASGAIGVVQKHHAPQIAQQDVILGDEQSRNKAAVLYTDYFNDAQKLQSLAASLASSEAAANFSANQAELAHQLQVQYSSHM